MKKIAVFTATRADYGVLYWLMKEIDKSDDFRLSIIASGTHLEKKFGYSLNEIEKDFKVDYKIKLPLNKTAKKDLTNSMAVLQKEISNVFENEKIDYLVVLGDRYELMPVVSSAVVYNIPIIHLHAGEVTKGAIDDKFRNAVSLMSDILFCSTKQYKKNLINFGIDKNKIFNVGALGIENIYRLKLLSKKEFEKQLGLRKNKKNYLITYHNETMSKISPKKQIKILLDALNEIDEDINLIFTKANADFGGVIINKEIEKFVKNKKNGYLFDNLGQIKYLSALKNCDMVIGNSSSGIIEAPSFNIPVINIGNRQEGRLSAKSVYDCKLDKKLILDKINKIKKKKIKKKNIYEKYKYPSKKVIEILKVLNND